MTTHHSNPVPTNPFVRSSKEGTHAFVDADSCDQRKGTLQETDQRPPKCSERIAGPAMNKPSMQPDHPSASGVLKKFLSLVLHAARSNIYLQAAARGIAEGKEIVRSWDEPKMPNSADTAFTNTSSSPAALSRRDSQSGSGTVGILGVLAGMAITAWMLVITLDGTRVQGRVDLGVVTSAVGGFPLGGTGLSPVEGRGTSRGRMFSMLQVTGGVFYPLYEPLVVEQRAPLVLLTLRNGRRHICDRQASVCARTADAAREIKVDRPSVP